MNTENNQRTRETDRRIKQTVFTLMIRDRKPIHRITVRDVCEGAGIHRSTFYAHYQDVYEVVEKAERNMSVHLAETFLKQLDSGAGAEACFESLFAFIGEHREFYRLYLNETHKAGVIGIATDLFQERFPGWDPDPSGSVGREYHLTFFLYGLTAMVRAWINGGCLQTPAELCRILKQQGTVQDRMMDW